MNTNYKVLALAVIVVFVFGMVYAGIGIEHADATKAKKNSKINSAKAKKGLMTQKISIPKNIPKHK